MKSTSSLVSRRQRVATPYNQALRSDRGISSVLNKGFSRVPAQAPAPFLAPPRSDRIDVPRRVNAQAVGQLW